MNHLAIFPWLLDGLHFLSAAVINQIPTALLSLFKLINFNKNFIAIQFINSKFFLHNLYVLIQVYYLTPLFIIKELKFLKNFQL